MDDSLWFYSFASGGTDLLTSLLFERRVYGLENVPKSGQLIIVANHLSLIDPPLLGAVMPRPMRFMAKKELFDRPVVGTAVRAYRAFAVRRGEADRQALATAQRLLQQGEAIAIFPEGTRSRVGKMQPAHPGVAVIALRTGAPVLPVGIWGSERLFKWPPVGFRPRLEVRIGEPFTLSTEEQKAKRELIEEMTAAIMRRVAALVPAAYRGVYSDLSGPVSARP